MFDPFGFYREHYLSPIHQAMIYAALHETDEAVLHLENALENRDPWMLWLAADPRFDNLRENSRFREMEEFVISESVEKNIRQQT